MIVASERDKMLNGEPCDAGDPALPAALFEPGERAAGNPCRPLRSP